ncbi:putative MFS transporter, AGZA family, xanthine/uracil permease [Mesobacillus persicus]|uniref:Putative MFS transporter, AGZA family, xanthine/uracil permease n=1 Tax=Mesobacillus persicus TaxID=930146 RepID=A0A1H7W6B4_9BACI|nr:NCS2 family permease [Mesobacillus persicus]SEM17142.1 putative MFS transporter, AGZA family, xanthine/uracil permease [Mesobacillus persicus]
MERFFNLKQHETTIGKELSAGFISYITVVYIIIVNATILSVAGIPMEAGIIATILTSFFGCLIIGLWSNTPILLIPGMGLNAMFTYTIVQSGGFSWQEALATVFVAGIIFIIIAFTPLAKIITTSIPDSLKEAITVGIGILLILIGFDNAGIITNSEHTLLAIGDLSSSTAIITFIGLIITLLLFIKNVPGNLLLSIVITSVLAVGFGESQSAGVTLSTPNFSEYFMVFGQLSWAQAGNFIFWLTAISLAMVLVFENIGLIHGHSKMLKRPESSKKSLQATAVSVLSSGVFGTSPTVASVESAAGITAGGKTGLTSIVTGVLFLVSLLFIPVIKAVPPSAVSPVLILIGLLMLQNIVNIPIDDLTDSVPALLIIVLIPLTYSIADGMAIGFILYPVMKLLMGKGKEIHPALYMIALLFISNYVLQYAF